MPESVNIVKEQYDDSSSEGSVDNESVSSGSEDNSVGGGSEASYDTAELLGGDPLFLVLSKFFMTADGQNIADILLEISHNLKKLNKALTKA